MEVGDHIYTTDYFQMSAFNPGHQIISIYYFVKAIESIQVPIRTKPFDFDQQQLDIYKEKGEIETFRMLSWEEFIPENVTLPIDKTVVNIVRTLLATSY